MHTHLGMATSAAILLKVARTTSAAMRGMSTRALTSGRLKWDCETGSLSSGRPQRSAPSEHYCSHCILYNIDLCANVQHCHNARHAPSENKLLHVHVQAPFCCRRVQNPNRCLGTHLVSWCCRFPHVLAVSVTDVGKRSVNSSEHSVVCTRWATIIPQQFRQQRRCASVLEQIFYCANILGV